MPPSRAAHRLDALAERLASRGRSRGAPRGRGRWDEVQALFTADVTSRELRQLLEHDPQDTFRYFTREIDWEELNGQPWHRRWPRTAWQVFLALAHRLSPARRVVFAAAVPILVLGWLQVFASRLLGGRVVTAISGFELALVASTGLFFLLVLELRDKLTLKGDLEIARDIQFGLLPLEPFARGGITVHSAMRPANTVGGDYFDLIELDGDCVALVMADVAGKGIPAALLMALLQASLRTLISAGFRGEELLIQLDRHLYGNIPTNRLVTCFYGELELASGRLRYVNAGHNPPLVIPASGPLRRLEGTAIVLGALPDQRFESAETTIGPGERLFLYTDGLTEAFDPAEREYGEPRLGAFLERNRGLPPDRLIAGVLADVLAFCGTSRPHDDMTQMLVCRAAPAEDARDSPDEQARRR